MQKPARHLGVTALKSLIDREPSQLPAVQDLSWSASLQSTLDQPPARLPGYLCLGGIAFCLCFGAWACLGQIDQVSHARGRLIPKGDIYKIHAVESGKVTKLLVQEGQIIKAGQVLAELDSEISSGEVERLRQILTSDQIQHSQMQMLTARSRLEAQQQQEMSSADAQGQVAAIAQAQTKADTIRELLAQLRVDEAAQQARLAKLASLANQGAISQERLFEVEQALRERQSSITKSQGELAQASSEISQLQAGRTQKRLNGDRLHSAAQQQTQQLEVEMTRLTAKIAETQTLLAIAAAKRNQRFLSALVDGIVTSMMVRNVGEVVQPGQTIAEIAPLNSPLLLQANLPNQEAGFIKVDMPVHIKLDAYPYQDYGVIPGKVVAISPDTKLSEQSEPVYQVEVALDRDFITAHHQTISVKLGQTATAEIVIRRRRMIDVLLEPIKQLQTANINS